MRAPLDFIGINLYYRTIASAPGALDRLTHPQEWLFPAKMAGGQQGPKTDMGWEVWPQAMYDMVMRITRNFNRPQIEITESGCAYNDGPDANGVIRDTRRIQYHRQYLRAVARAMAEAPTSAVIMPGACWITSNGRRVSASASAWPMWISRRNSAPSKNRDNGTQRWLLRIVWDRK
jgi:hypothetical protein